MAKRQGKVKPQLNVESAERFGHSQDKDLGASRRDAFNAQVYVDKFEESSKAYRSSMDALKENLRVAIDGFEKVNEKGMTDSVFSAIEKISDIRRQQIELVSQYANELATFDSERLQSIRETKDEGKIFIADRIDKALRRRNNQLQEDLTDLDSVYDSLEASITEQTTAQQKKTIRQQQQDVLTQKYAAMLDYVKFLQDKAVQRDTLLNPVDLSSKEREEILRSVGGDVQGKDPVQPGQEKGKADPGKLGKAFSNASMQAKQKFEKFKSLPVIHALYAGGAAIGRKLSPKLSAFKDDLLAGYAVMKENRQERKVEHEIAKLDAMREAKGREPFLSRVQQSLSGQAEEGYFAADESPVSVPEPAPIPGETAAGAQVPSQDSPAPVSAGDDAPSRDVPAESQHDRRVRVASNRATLDALAKTDLAGMINDYFWSDTAETKDILHDLSSSDNVFTDLTPYVDRLKRVISHMPEAVQEPLNQKIEASMSSVYQAHVGAKAKVKDMEERITEAEEYLSSLDGGQPSMQME